MSSAPGTDLTIGAAAQSFVRATKEVQTSAEYLALPDAVRCRLDDLAEDIEQEVAKTSPNPGRIRKWGERFLFGLRSTGIVAAEKVIEVAFAALLAALAPPE